jgi:hypothetical protein
MHDTMPMYRSLVDGLRDPRYAPNPKIPAGHRNSIVQAIPAAVPFDMTNVEQWATVTYGDTDIDSISDALAELPCCTPPYPHTFVEFSVKTAATARLAALVVAAEQRGQLPRMVMGRDDLTERPISVDIPYRGYAVTFYPFGSLRPDRIVGPGGYASLILTPDGEIKRYEWDGKPEPCVAVGTFPGAVDWDDADDLRGFTALLTYDLLVAFFGFSLCHCANVEERHERLPRPMARERERKKLEPIVWKVLDIKPVRKPRTPNEVADELAAPKKRLHTVRGHYASYGPKYGTGLLFGRIEGRFYVPPHVRGDEDAGKIAKDYRVKAR